MNNKREEAFVNWGGGMGMRREKQSPLSAAQCETSQQQGRAEAEVLFFACHCYQDLVLVHFLTLRQ